MAGYGEENDRSTGDGAGTLATRVRLKEVIR